MVKKLKYNINFGSIRFCYISIFAWFVSKKWLFISIIDQSSFSTSRSLEKW